ncbi:L,D-transpeptidase [Pelomonas cellulosilytica]|uniref:L,D-transpeptidase n=1 Tax=Pelomonas cellulosilytica TaxID=2906762 RepID=A0ABS8XUI6_9BURK|nr:L,D-transpeptidase [Pelomonas sp. P8]MCE4555548.1 L,D-transpeptidase [Pelomonas sp. P8]
MAAASADVAVRPVAHDAQDGRPFAIVDKRQATLSVYAADGHLVGRTAALLGLTPGDVEPASARGKTPGQLGTHERVTPAGRFEAIPGRNLNGERVVWFNYDTHLAIHRLRPVAASQRRPERLVSAHAQDHRITFGCVVVDPAFFDDVVLPTLGNGPSLVYILPERDAVAAGTAGSSRAAAAP